MRRDNDFSLIGLCVYVCLSVCLYVCNALIFYIFFRKRWHEKFIFGMQAGTSS